MLFYSHDVVGLGHINRTLAVIEELAGRRPDAPMLLLSGSPHAHGFSLPPNVGLTRLPSVDAHGHGSERSTLAAVWSERERIIADAVAAFAPDLVYVDHLPTGANRELVTTIHNLRATRPAVRFVVGLCDVIDTRPAVWAWWRRNGSAELLEAVYDRILVGGDPRVFNVVAEYRFPPALARKTVFTGYLLRRSAMGDGDQTVDLVPGAGSPLIVVTVGGGADGAALVRAYLTAIRERSDTAWRSFILTGPLMDGREAAELAELANGLPDVTLTAFVPDPMRYFAAADLVVTMGGWGTLVEAVALGRRVIVVPRVRPAREQVLRAERFAALGLATMIHPADLTPARLWAAIEAGLASPLPAAWIACDGAARTADAIEELLAEQAGICPC